MKGNIALVELSEKEMAEIDSIISSNVVAGDRFHPSGMSMPNL